MADDAVIAPVKVPPTVMLPLAALRPSPGPNPNYMDKEREALLSEAIGEFGFLQPVLVIERSLADAVAECAADGTDFHVGGAAAGEWAGRAFQVIDGHHRLDIMVARGAPEIPCVVLPADTPKEDVTRLRLALNRLRGEVDLTAASRMLAELHHDDGLSIGDLTLSGFTAREVEAFLEVAAGGDDGLSGSDHSDPAGAEEVGGTPDASPPKFTLEVEFDSAADLKKAKAILRKADPKKKKDMARGLKAITGME